MRNEGPFILEWVAYHRVIGFDRVVVCSNDCSDGSDNLLDALDAAGIVTHLPHTPQQGESPQDSGIRAAFGWLESTDIEWLAHIDADEFINIGLGEGKVQNLLDKAGQGDVIALAWWAFGDNGLRALPDDVLPSLTRSEKWPNENRVKFKSMFRFRQFEHANDHMPRGPKTATPQIRSARGDVLDTEGLSGAKRAKYRPFDKSIRVRAACVNHYAVPSRDAFLMKNDRGDGQGKRSDKYHLGSRWHRIANRNDIENTRILRHWPATQDEMMRLRALQGLRDAELACTAWHAQRRLNILTPGQIGEWTKPGYVDQSQ